MGAKPKPKPKPGKPGAKGAPTTEEDPAKDIKKWLEMYTKLSDKLHAEPYQPLVKRLKAEMELQATPEEGANKGQPRPLPNLPIIIQDALEYPQVRALMEALQEYKYLHQASFWKAAIGDDGLMVISEFLQKSTRLKTLEILNSGIGVRGCGYLGKVLTQNDTLVNLVLDHNDIGDEGVELLGDGLKWNSSIIYLSLQYCGIGGAGGEAIAKYILRSSSVKELYLRGNCIGPTGVTAIAQAIAKNMVLTKLDVSDNAFGIDIEALEALRDGLESNESLTSVDIGLNSLVPAGAAMLLEVLKSKANIQDFRIHERTSENVFKEVIDQVNLNIKSAKKKGGKKGKGKKA